MSSKAQKIYTGAGNIMLSFNKKNANACLNVLKAICLLTTEIIG